MADSDLGTWRSAWHGSYSYSEKGSMKFREIIPMQIKCADCGCIPEDCRLGTSNEKCPNCVMEECCCKKVIS